MDLYPISDFSMLPSEYDLQTITNYEILDSLRLELSIIFMLFKLLSTPQNGPVPLYPLTPPFYQSTTHGYPQTRFGYQQTTYDYQPTTIENQQTTFYNQQTPYSNTNQQQQQQYSDNSTQSQSRSSSATWGYFGLQGPSNWNSWSTCGGQRQSPIDINSGLVTMADMGPLFFTNYQNPAICDVTNNGHTVQFDVSANTMTMSGGGLNGVYQVEQFHFHWGANDSLGSEHTVNGRTFPLEIHVVHYKQSYGSLADAVIKPDGIAVLAALFDISGSDNPAFNGLLTTLEKVRNPKETTQYTVASLGSLLPSYNGYYRYLGGLTTPPCSESVIWTISSQSVPISSNQMQAFRRLISSEIDSNGQYLPLVNNFRPTQNLYNRRILTNVVGQGK